MVLCGVVIVFEWVYGANMYLNFQHLWLIITSWINYQKLHPTLSN